jgi:hypothetical protein
MKDNGLINTLSIKLSRTLIISQLIRFRANACRCSRESRSVVKLINLLSCHRETKGRELEVSPARPNS